MRVEIIHIDDASLNGYINHASRLPLKGERLTMFEKTFRVIDVETRLPSNGEIKYFIYITTIY